MSCCNNNTKSKPSYVGVLGDAGSARTQFDLKQNKKFDYGCQNKKQKKPVKEGFCACNSNQGNRGRTLAFDDPDNSLSYNVRY